MGCPGTRKKKDVRACVFVCESVRESVCRRILQVAGKKISTEAAGKSSEVAQAPKKPAGGTALSGPVRGAYVIAGFSVGGAWEVAHAQSSSSAKPPTQSRS